MAKPQPFVMTRICHAISLESEAEESHLQGQLGLYSEL